MVIKMADEVDVQKEVVIPAPAEEAPEELHAMAREFVDMLAAKLEKKTEDYTRRMTSELQKSTEVGAEIGTVIGGFRYWDCLTYGPVALSRLFPPRISRYMPNKIVAHTDWALMVGLIWINPVAPPFAPPPTLQLGGRQFSARFETVNLSTVQNGPDGIPVVYNTTNPWPGTAPVITRMYWLTHFPDPGPRPNLYEVTLTVDLTLGDQPFALFSTWHEDPDEEPGFLTRPTMPRHWQFERPARFMVYHR